MSPPPPPPPIAAAIPLSGEVEQRTPSLPLISSRDDAMDIDTTPPTEPSTSAAVVTFKCFQEGLISKSELEESLRAKHEAWKEMQSEERDRWAVYTKTEGDNMTRMLTAFGVMRGMK